MAIEPNPIPPELPGPGQDVPPPEVPIPTDPNPVPQTPPQLSQEFDLERFISAQEPVIEQVYRELRAGRKQTHWMWFIFPQLVGLGRSAMAQRYAIGSLAEAQAYLDHPVLGRRLIELTDIVNAVSGRSVHEIFGSPDDMKFHSSVTLFAAADPRAAAFGAALDKYFGGQLDRGTEEGLGSG